MKAWKLLFISTLIAGLALPLWAVAEQGNVHRWEEHSSDIHLLEEHDFTADYLDEIDEYMAVMDNETHVFLELDISNDLLENELEPKNLREIIEAHTNELPRNSDEIAWKWDLTNIPPYYDYGQFRTEDKELHFARRFDVSSVGNKKGDQDFYVAATELSKSVANVEVYTEFGITGGRLDAFGESNLSAEEIEEAIELDLSGYYVAGGANLGLGRWTLGLEAGYGSDTTSNNTKQTDFAGVSDSSQLIGQVGGGTTPRGSIPQNPQSSSLFSLVDDPFKLVYFQGTADRSVTEKLGVKLGAIYFAVPEQFVTDFEGQDVNNYGFELFGDVNYQLAKSIKYTLYMDYALTDERFEEENIYQILNRVEFNF